MLPVWFVYLGAACNLAGASSYAWATLRGRTHPNRISWGLWALIPLIAFAASLDEGAGERALMTFMVGFGPAVILACSLASRSAYWRITRLDLACGSVSVAAIGAWALTGDGLSAILLAVLADLTAGVPTLVKAWAAPQTESAGVFWLASLSALITLATIDEWALATFAFPAYILAFCLVAALLISRPRLHRQPRR